MMGIQSLGSPLRTLLDSGADLIFIMALNYFLTLEGTSLHCLGSCLVSWKQAEEGSSSSPSVDNGPQLDKHDLVSYPPAR